MGSLLSRARLLRERPVYPSGGLLRKARSLRGRVIENPDTGSIDPLLNKEQDVMAEMDAILGQNTLAITDDTLKFSARATGALFPLMVNLGAAALMVVVGTGLFFLFDRGEASRIDNAVKASSAESRIITAVREESRRELALKTEEINSIQKQLRDAENARSALIAETENELLRREAQLKEILSEELEAERLRLQKAGFSDTDMNAQLSRYREQQQQEYDRQLAAANTELEARLEERSAELNRQTEEYRQALNSAMAEQKSIREQIAAVQEEAARNLKEVNAERNTALAKINELNRQQHQVDLVEEYLFSMFETVHDRMNEGDFRQAARQLDGLEEFINSPAAEAVMLRNNRKQVELFLVHSLRRLIDSEARQAEGPSTMESLLASISAGLEEGNRLFDAGRLEEAQEIYTEALNTIPEIQSLYSRLKETEARLVERERRLLEVRLAEGDSLFQDSRYQASVEQYREALEILERKSPSLDRLFKQLMDAGYYLGSENEEQPEPVIITEVVREELSTEDRELVETARSAEIRRSRLLYDLERLRARFASGSAGSEPESSMEDIISLLNTKLLIRQALASTEVRENFPDLYRTADAVFEGYSKEQHEAGRTKAFSDMVAITEYLRENPEAKVPLEESMNTRQRELFLQFLENLGNLLERISGEGPGQSSAEM